MSKLFNGSPISLLVILIVSTACLLCVLSPVGFLILESQVLNSGPSDDVIKQIVIAGRNRSEDQVQDFSVLEKERCLVSLSNRERQNIKESWRVVVKFMLNDPSEAAPVERTEHWAIFRNDNFWFGQFEPISDECKQ